MKELIETGLFGRGLIPVDTPKMVSRYNACLEDMGLPKTKRKKFFVDALGWSPEIAAEMEDDYYLSHGEANPLAIILFPEQRHAPIYFPFHSFDWDLMRQWFDTHKPQVAEVTRHSGIWLDIDQEVEVYRSPEDLLMVDGVNVQALTPPRIMVKTREQRELVRRFTSDPEAYKDADLIASLEVSQSEVGDMRRKSVVIDNMQYSDVRCFFTRAFGGVFVLRDDNLDSDIIASKDPALAKNGKQIVQVSGKPFLNRLQKSNFVTFDEKWWRQRGNLLRLNILQESFLTEVLDAEHWDLDFFAQTSAQQKGIIKGVVGKLPDEYFEFERILSILKKKSGKIGDVTKNVTPLLLHPHPDTAPSVQEVLWHALTIIGGGRPVVRLYRHEKETFRQRFLEKWQTPSKRWAITRVREYHESRLMREV